MRALAFSVDFGLFYPLALSLLPVGTFMGQFSKNPTLVGLGDCLHPRIVCTTHG